MYLWALGVLQTRAFGWGLPSTMLVPLADCLNHDFSANMTLSLLEKTLHKSMNKIYLYKHNFEKKEGDTDEDSVYDKKNSKIKINCAKLFREDEASFSLMRRNSVNNSGASVISVVTGKKIATTKRSLRMKTSCSKKPLLFK